MVLSERLGILYLVIATAAITPNIMIARTTIIVPTIATDLRFWEDNP